MALAMPGTPLAGAVLSVFSEMAFIKASIVFSMSMSSLMMMVLVRLRTCSLNGATWADHAGVWAIADGVGLLGPSPKLAAGEKAAAVSVLQAAVWAIVGQARVDGTAAAAEDAALAAVDGTAAAAEDAALAAGEKAVAGSILPTDGSG